METKYDLLVGFFLNNWGLSVVVLICVALMAIPQVRDGFKMVREFLQYAFKRWIKQDIYIYQKDGEKVVMTRVLRSKELDVVRIDTTSHDLGIQSEYAWLKEFYPKYEHRMQCISTIQTEQGEKVFDSFPISNRESSKEIYFDISSFFEKPLTFIMNENEYISHRIKMLYSKME